MDLVVMLLIIQEMLCTPYNLLVDIHKQLGAIISVNVLLPFCASSAVSRAL